MKKYATIDLFASCGGFSEGLKMAGFEILVANEINHDAINTYRANHPETIMIERDVKNLKSKEILDATHKKIFLVAGGPPCQGFSLAGKRDINDPRNALFKEFVRIVEDLSPKFFIMENVSGLLSMDSGNFIKSMVSAFENIGYKTDFTCLDASNFGVPQTRRRVFIVGCDRSIDFRELRNKRSAVVSVKDAIGDLDFLEAGEKSERYKKPAITPYQNLMRGKNYVLTNHEASHHSQRVIRRFSFLKEGQSANSLPRKFRTKKFSLHRLYANRPSRTLTTLPDDNIHYSRDRILTVREMARLQSFRDSYLFFGPKTTGGKRRSLECPQYTQVGNAVPPLLARGVGKWILGNS